MTEAQWQSSSFVLRIWWEDRRWRGWVQHAATGQMTYVHNVKDLLAFIQQYTGNLGSGGKAIGVAPTIRPQKE